MTLTQEGRTVSGFKVGALVQVRKKVDYLAGVTGTVAQADRLPRGGWDLIVDIEGTPVHFAGHELDVLRGPEVTGDER